MALHGLVHVQGVNAGGIEAGEPHVAHDHQAQRVGGVFEALFQAFFDLAVVDVGAQQGFVAGRSGHHDLDGAFLGVWVVPVRAQLDDLVVQVHADVTAHGHDHGFARLGGASLFKVRDQVSGHAGDTGFGTDNLFQGGPAAFELGLLAFFFVLGQLIHFVVNAGQVFVFQPQLGQARLVVDGHRGAIFLGLLHVVDVDVLAKHSTGVMVGAADRGASEAHEGGIRQGITQMLGVARLVFLLAGLTFEGGLEAVLGAVGLVRDHNDVAALGQHREGVFILTRHELLDRGEDDAARGAVAQLGAQVWTGQCLGGLLPQQVLGQAEHPKQLPIQVVAVGDNHDGGVLHRGFLHHTGGKAGHGDALAAALGVPHHTALAGGTRSGCGHHFFDGGAHGVELVVACNLLDELTVVLEQDKVTDVVQQVLWGQHTTHQGLQFLKLPQWVEVYSINRAPSHKALGVGRQRTHQRVGAVRDHQHLVVLEHVRYLLFVRLDLVEGLPDVGVLVGGVLDFQQHQRQAVEEQDDVGAAGFVGTFDGELVDGPPFVLLGVCPVDQANEVAACLAILLILDGDTTDQQLVKRTVGRQQGWDAQVSDLLDSIFTSCNRNARVQAVDGFAQPERQDNLAVVGTLGRRTIEGDVGAVAVGVAHVLQPGQGFLFELVFGHCAIPSMILLFALASCTSVCRVA